MTSRIGAAAKDAGNPIQTRGRALLWRPVSGKHGSPAGAFERVTAVGHSRCIDRTRVRLSRPGYEIASRAAGGAEPSLRPAQSVTGWHPPGGGKVRHTSAVDRATR